MFNLLFKTGTYYVLWHKFRGQFIYLLVSAIFIVLTFSIYEDIYNVLKTTDKDSLWVLMLIKYSVLMLIIALNIRHFRAIKVKAPPQKPKKRAYKIKLDPIEEYIKQKPVLKSKTDFILEKYKNKKDV